MSFGEQGYDEKRFQNVVSRDLHCAICHNVFKDPLMCSRNKHYFCRPCISRHVINSQTCPVCMDQLTLETLRPAPAVLTNSLAELNIRCDYSNRGCPQIIQLKNLPQHTSVCGFSPVVCSNEGCYLEINKQDQIHHENEICEFRKLDKCPGCGQVKRDLASIAERLEGLEKSMTELCAITGHMVEIKEGMNAIQKNQSVVSQMMINTLVNQVGVNEEIKGNMNKMKDQLVTLTYHVIQGGKVESETSEPVGRKGLTRSVSMQPTRSVPEESSRSSPPESTRFTPPESTRPAPVEPTTSEQYTILTVGGYTSQGVTTLYSNVGEKYSWSKQSWAPLQSLTECRAGASSFIFQNQMIVTGGFTGTCVTDSMETLHINPDKDSEPWSKFPAKLPSKLSGHATVVYNDRLIVIGGDDGKTFSESVYEVLLVPPHSIKLLTRMAQGRWRHSAQLFNDKVLICGGMTSLFNRDTVQTVLMYDIGRNEVKQLPPLPYAVCDMATVKFGDKLIVIGGLGKDGNAKNTSVMYDVKTGQSHALPKMKDNRMGCTAVLVGNTIVVIGGRNNQGACLKSVEKLTLDNSVSWEELPPMNTAMFRGTAAVVVQF